MKDRPARPAASPLSRAEARSSRGEAAHEPDPPCRGPAGPDGSEDVRMRLVEEGGVRFRTPSVCPTARGPGSRDGPAFYNRAMAVNRDLAAAVALHLALEHGRSRDDGAPFRALDGLAASGVRGLRFARELRPAFGDGPTCPVELTLNDADPRAVRVIRANAADMAGCEDAGSPNREAADLAGSEVTGGARHNAAGDGEAAGQARREAAIVGELELGPGTTAQITRSDVRVLLLSRRFNYVDIDPYGSPAGFFQAAAAGLYRGGVVGFTATDTPALCGVYPRTSLRRYGARSMRCHFGHECAARILAGAAIRAAASLDVALEPVLTQSEDHFIRVYLRRVGGAQDADSLLGKMGHALVDGDVPVGRLAGPTDIHPAGYGRDGDDELRPLRRRWAGPLWVGPLQDPAFAGGVAQQMRGMVERSQMGQAEDDGAGRVGAGEGARPYGRRLERLAGRLETAASEAHLPPFHHQVDILCSELGISPPSMEAIRERLEGAGHSFSRTIFDPVGFRTDAPADLLVGIMRDASKTG